MTGQILFGPYLAASLIGFAAGTVISALLLALTSRASKLPGTPAANILFAVCSLLWNLTGFAHTTAITLGVPESARVAQRPLRGPLACLRSGVPLPFTPSARDLVSKCCKPYRA